MLQGWVVVLTTIIYIVILFAVAKYGDSQKHHEGGNRGRPYIYALSLAIYCTTWTIFGSVGFAASNGLNFIAIYLGPILIITLGYPLLQKVLLLSKSQRITSVADFIGARYGKSAVVGGVAASIAVIGTLPYIALQLKAISDSVSTLISHYAVNSQSVEPSLNNVTVIIALLLAVFAVLFGTRHADATEHQHGMMLAIAMESVVKLLAFLTVGIFVTFFVFNGFGDLWAKAEQKGIISRYLEQGFDAGNFLILLILSALVFLLLPRQFHVVVVENKSFSELAKARWLFPLYLLAINIFVIPIALAGLIIFDNTVPADNFVLELPMSQESAFGSLMAFLGGLSAGTAMVIVACVALAIMVSNHIVLPLFLRQKAYRDLSSPRNMEQLILNIRRTTIFILLLAAYTYNRAADNSSGLVSIGLVSFAAISQLAPAFFGGLFWRRANSRGALAGMLIGFSIWAFTLLLPTLLSPDNIVMREGLFGLSWLHPERLFDINLSPLGNGVFFSLSLNTLGMILGSLSRPSNALELIQSSVFVQSTNRPLSGKDPADSNVTVGDLRETIAQYLGNERTRRSFDTYKAQNNIVLLDTDPANSEMLQFSQQLLASAVGASTSRLVHSLLIKRLGHSSKSEIKLLDDASQALQFNRGVLQTALDQIEQGICVFDSEYRLSSWNRQFREMLNLPISIGTPGTSFSTIIYEIVKRNQLFRFGYDEEMITRNLIDLKNTWQFELPLTGEIIDVRSALMPQGGLVLTWQDNTDRVLSANALSDANVMLEKRVEERTIELTALNKRLEKATKVADQANLDKTRFLAAVGHDILQPLNAARLYSSTLIERLHDEGDQDFALNVNRSLDSVEDILGAVLAISHLDASPDEVKLNAISLNPVFEQLENEFRPVAEKENLELIFVKTSAVVRTDPSLLKRLLQNLISNALKYTIEGKVLVGCRPKGDKVSIEILDTGIGIAPEDQPTVFKEFKRLPEGVNTASGLGLGLSIVERISARLDCLVEIESIPAKGTCIRVLVERTTDMASDFKKSIPLKAIANNIIPNIKVLCVDNDPFVLKGLSGLLDQWGCLVYTAPASASAIQLVKEQELIPDIILMDYHLNDETGVEAIRKLRLIVGENVPAVLVTAERSGSLKQKAKQLDLAYITKPVKPAALRSVLASVRKINEAAE
jgi:Na+/proline symporter/signal transduction histidine kinase/CheY-like chemotaxis protein